MRANHKWGTVSKMYSKSFIVILLEKPTWTRAPSFLFPLVLPSQAAGFWLGSSGSWTHCLPQLVPRIAPSRASLCSVSHRNQRHRWDQYQDRPALPVRIQCSRKFANSPSAAPLVSHYHTAMKDSGASAALLFLTFMHENHLQTIYHLSAVSVRPISLKLNQSPSAQTWLLSSALIVCMCLGGRAVGCSDSLQRIVNRRSCQEAVSKYICRQICFCMTCVFCLSICALWRSCNSTSRSDRSEEVLSWKSSTATWTHRTLKWI